MIRSVLVAGAIALATCGLALYTKERAVSFHDVRDAKARIASAGFRCTSDRSDGDLVTGFLVSRQPITWYEVGTLCKGRPMGPHWEGKVWVTQKAKDILLMSLPEQVGVRVWGDVLAYGDEEFLSEIENSL